jgi:hypothetical protein
MAMDTPPPTAPWPTDKQLAALKKLEYSEDPPTPFLREMMAEIEFHRENRKSYTAP